MQARCILQQIRIVNRVAFCVTPSWVARRARWIPPSPPSLSVVSVPSHRSDSPFQGTDCDETDWRNVAAQRCRPPGQRRWKHEEVTTWRIATEGSQSVGQWVVVLRVVASAGCVRTRTYTRPADRQAGRQSKPASKQASTDRRGADKGDRLEPWIAANAVRLLIDFFLVFF